MLVAYDDRLTEHLARLEHPERPDRVRVVARELERRGMLNNRIDTAVARPDELARVHTRRYIELVQRECPVARIGRRGAAFYRRHRD